MIILDAGVLIAHATVTDVFHAEATTLLLDAAGEPFATSVITMGEALVRYAMVGQADTALEGFHRLGVEVLEIPPSASVELAELRHRVALRMPECCVLYIAQKHAATAIATFDERLGRTARHLGFTVLGWAAEN